MYKHVKYFVATFTLVSTITFATEQGFYADGGIGVSAGPSSVLAHSRKFFGSGGTITGASSDTHWIRTQSAFGAYSDLGYNFNRYFGIEANYTYWGVQALTSFTGQITIHTGGISGSLYSQSVGGNLVGYIPLDKINIYTKLGSAAVFSTLRINDPRGSIFFNPGNYAQTRTQPTLTYGAGIQYQYNPNTYFQLGWSGITQLTTTTFTNIYYNMAAVGIKYQFSNHYSYK